jgi:predicted nuclease of predicted toxin-antitoxin system
MRFLIDMNLSPQWVDYLTAAGHEATHWSAVGAGNATDRELMAHATAGSMVILTQDLDFGTLLALGGATTPSVIQFRAQAVLPADIGPQLLAAIEAAADHLRSGALVTVDPQAHRLTLLPIERS